MSSTTRVHVEQQLRRIPDERLDLVSAFLDALTRREVVGDDEGSQDLQKRARKPLLSSGG